MSSLLSPFQHGHKHAYFSATITLHELVNIPLLQGEFALSWKVQHAVSSSGRKGHLANQLHAEQDDRPKLSISTSNESLAARRAESPRVVQSPESTSSDGARAADGSACASPAPGSPVATAIRDLGMTPRTMSSTAPTSPATPANRSAESLVEAPHDAPRSPQEPTWHRLRQLRECNESRRVRHRTGSLSSRSALSGPPSEPRGQTVFARVQDRKAKLERKLDVVVRIPIGKRVVSADERDTDGTRSPRIDSPTAGLLGEAQVAIKVLQQVRTISGIRSQASEEQSTLGTVHFNLAEYAPESPALPTSSGSSAYSGMSTSGTRTETRQYLLDECMANVLLRVTVEMRFLGATPVLYRVPPIRDGIVDLASIMAPGAGDVAGLSEDAGRADAALRSERDDPLGESPGLEWHYKLPTSQLFRATAVPREHLQASDREALCPMKSCLGLMTGDASGPRMAFCDTNTDQLIDELFEGHFGPAADNRLPPSPPLTEDSQKQRSNVARKRWDKIVHNLGHLAQQADPTRPLRQASGRHDGSDSPLHPHSPHLADIVDRLRHNLPMAHDFVRTS
ncbi:hypothetical protein MBRA1_003342 [Malassezia brasiliensis]|uniref:C2 NT-type domain-containing protein n=1 Tax=Malassezia brasiliensis TaxID=1821822 RepID=A0AAF0DVR4_9BASI|nr:hypothetical protein MBRA1_003342 [Malassezia brasiliensis]